MSGVLNTFVDFLVGASFRGIPFHVDAHERTFGRRVVQHEFPLRDDPYAEDLGRRARTYHLRAYVIGDLYLLQREALVAACEAPGPGTLVHPYLGTLTVLCIAGRQAENKNEGGWATLDLTFGEAGSPPSPTSLLDTASSLYAQATSALGSLESSFASLVGIAGFSGFTQGAFGSILGQAAAGILSLPLVAIFGLVDMASGIFSAGNASAPVVAARTQVLAALTGTPTFPAQTAAAIGGAVTGYVATIAAAVDAGTLGADPSGGLAALATWGAALPPVVALTPDSEQQAVNQAALVALVQGSAVCAMAQAYADADWPDAPAATAARDQLTGLIDTQSDAAALAGQNDLYAAWQALYAAAATDLTQRAQSLPSLAAYATPGSLPSLALSQRLYQSAANADALAQLNAVPHPAFMPTSGLYLLAN